ncbi:MAG: HAD family hydrolase [Oscillospiraceae bacterium]|nr:HAD family hydrolase [Oscillospiraceae bacterium]
MKRVIRMKNVPKIKTVVVDLDRTLLHTDKTLSPYTLEVLKACKEKGLRLLIATARPQRTAEQFYERIGAHGMVVSNGARVICGNKQTEYGICRESAERLLRYLNRYPDLRITLETGDIAYSNKPIADYETILSDNLVGIAKAEGVLKILVQLDRKDTLAVVEKGLTDDLYYTVAHGYLMQIMNKSATKWNGIKAMLEICSCSPKETAYFGDDHDDLEPIKLCGMGIAVANGIDEVKTAADCIAESNDEDGVARFIEQVLLRKL